MKLKEGQLTCIEIESSLEYKSESETCYDLSLYVEQKIHSCIM